MPMPNNANFFFIELILTEKLKRSHPDFGRKRLLNQKINSF